MNKKLVAAGLVVAGISASQFTFADSAVCERQKAAAPDLVEARDDGVALEEVEAAIDSNASSEASARVLKESLARIYESPDMSGKAAADLIHQRCVDALGA